MQFTLLILFFALATSLLDVVQAQACSYATSNRFKSLISQLDDADAVFSAHTVLDEEGERKRAEGLNGTTRHFGPSGFESVPPYKYDLIVDKVWRGNVLEPMTLSVDRTTSCATDQAAFGPHILFHVTSEHVIWQRSQPILADPSTIQMIDAYFDMLNRSDMPIDLEVSISSDVVPAKLEITGPPALVDPVSEFCKLNPIREVKLGRTSSPLTVYWPGDLSFVNRSDTWRTEAGCLQYQLSTTITRPRSFTLDVVLKFVDADRDEPSFIFGRSRYVGLKRPDVRSSPN